MPDEPEWVPFEAPKDGGLSVRLNAALAAEPRPCPDCGVSPGEIHKDGCDVERCRECGRQRISCACVAATDRRLAWTGQWPGNEAAARLGLWCRWTDRGWEGCSKDHPDARPDLNKLAVFGVGDAERGEWVGVRGR